MDYQRMASSSRLLEGESWQTQSSEMFPISYSRLPLLFLQSSLSLPPSTRSSKMSQKRRFSREASGTRCLAVLGQWQGGGQMTSRDSLSAWSSIWGMMRVRRGQASSRQGLVLISMSQGLNSLSIMKSSPKIQKLCLYLSGDSFTNALFTASKQMLLILGRILSSKLQFSLGWAVSRYFWNSAYDSLLAGQCRPQRGVYFWTASLVRCISLSKLKTSNSQEAVRMQPSLYQQALNTPLSWLIIMQCRMSNLRLRQRKGRSMQSCTMNVFSVPLSCFPSLFIIESSSYIQSITVMPFPRLVNSPGFTIQMFLIGRAMLTPFSESFYCLWMTDCRFLWQTVNRLYCGSRLPFLMWKVKGMTLKRLPPVSQQYSLRLQKRAFLLPRQKLLVRWLCILSPSFLTSFSFRQFCLYQNSLLRMPLVVPRNSGIQKSGIILLRKSSSLQRYSFFPLDLWDSLGSSFASLLASVRFRFSWRKNSGAGVCFLKKSLFLSWVHMKFASCFSYTICHQNLRLMSSLMRGLLLPPPTQAFSLLSRLMASSSGCSMSKQWPQLQFILKRNSRYDAILPSQMGLEYQELTGLTDLLRLSPFGEDLPRTRID